MMESLASAWLISQKDIAKDTSVETLKWRSSECSKDRAWCYLERSDTLVSQILIAHQNKDGHFLRLPWRFYSSLVLVDCWTPLYSKSSSRFQQWRNNKYHTYLPTIITYETGHYTGSNHFQVFYNLQRMGKTDNESYVLLSSAWNCFIK
jgi:hypothetical protein